jgi:hypothetical protein
MEVRVSFTPRLLYPQGKSLRYPLDRRLEALVSNDERYGNLYSDGESRL